MLRVRAQAPLAPLRRPRVGGVVEAGPALDGRRLLAEVGGVATSGCASRRPSTETKLHPETIYY